MYFMLNANQQTRRNVTHGRGLLHYRGSYWVCWKQSSGAHYVLVGQQWRHALGQVGRGFA